MSYDLRLKDSVSGQTLVLDFIHQIIGGTYALGGTSECSLNITYNYSSHFVRVFGNDGIRTLYGKSGAESIPILKKAIDELANDVDEDYWKPTEGNAKRALLGLLA